jgi:predicted amidophosphoribosyltransferase
MERFYMVCSNPNCKFSAVDDYQSKGCPYCAADLVSECPACQAPLRYKNQTFCGVCRQPIKPPAEASEPRT